MSIYRLEDGTILNTEKAKQQWAEARDWDGRNHIGRVSGGQWSYQTLYKSRKGRFYVEFHSAWQESKDTAEWVSEQEAVRWLLLNQSEIPEELKHLVEEVEE